MSLPIPGLDRSTGGQGSSNVLLSSAENSGIVRGNDILKRPFTGFYQPIRQLQMADPTAKVADIGGYAEQHALEVCLAVKETPAATGPYVEDMWLELGRMRQSMGEETFETRLGHVSEMIIERVVSLHQFGDNLTPWDVERYQPGAADLTMNATLRMRVIKDILRRTKGLCIELMSGYDFITRLVAFPLAVENDVMAKYKAIKLAEMEEKRHEEYRGGKEHWERENDRRFPDDVTTDTTMLDY